MVSPNPATSDVTASVVDNNNAQTPTQLISEVNIYNQQGDLKKHQKYNKVKQAHINVADLPSGVYFIEIINDTYKERKQLSILK